MSRPRKQQSVEGPQDQDPLDLWIKRKCTEALRVKYNPRSTHPSARRFSFRQRKKMQLRTQAITAEAVSSFGESLKPGILDSIWETPLNISVEPLSKMVDLEELRTLGKQSKILLSSLNTYNRTAWREKHLVRPTIPAPIRAALRKRNPSLTHQEVNSRFNWIYSIFKLNGWIGELPWLS